MASLPQSRSKRDAVADLTRQEQTGDRVIEFKRAKKTTDDDEDATRNSPGRCVSVGERYTKLGRIGEGTYGIVYKARDTQTQELVALKRCLPHHESSDGFPVTTLREIASLKTLSQHPSIVRLHHVAVSNRGVFLVFEYCQHDLAYLVDSHYMAHRKSPFSQGEVKQLFLQLLSALDFMHHKHLIHRDVKLSNLLYKSRGELKLADFGLSRKLSSNRQIDSQKQDEKTASLQPLTGKVVSLWYRPPELLLGSARYNSSVDNWGAGCVLGELLMGNPLLNGKNEADQISKVYELLGSPTEQDWPDLRNMPFIQDGTLDLPRPVPGFKPGNKSLLDRFNHLSVAGLTLLKDLLAYDYHKRCTASRALDSQYFTETPLPVAKQRMPVFPPKRDGT